LAVAGGHGFFSGAGSAWILRCCAHVVSRFLFRFGPVA
jgi:hypothetical protein